MNNELVKYLETLINNIRRKRDRDYDIDSQYSPWEIEKALKTLGWEWVAVQGGDSLESSHIYIYENEKENFALEFLWNGWYRQQWLTMAEPEED